MYHAQGFNYSKVTLYKQGKKLYTSYINSPCLNIPNTQALHAGPKYCIAIKISARIKFAIYSIFKEQFSMILRISFEQNFCSFNSLTIRLAIITCYMIFLI